MGQVIYLARTLGYMIWHDAATNAPRKCQCGRFSRGPRNASGWPDLVLVRPATERRPGRTIFCELKNERGKVSEHQTRWLEALEWAGAEVYVWRPSDLQQVGEILMADARP